MEMSKETIQDMLDVGRESFRDLWPLVASNPNTQTPQLPDAKWEAKGQNEINEQINKCRYFHLEGTKGFEVWNDIDIWVFPKIGVSPPNHPMLIGFSIINHPFWGTSIFGDTHMVKLQYHDFKNLFMKHSTMICQALGAVKIFKWH